MPAAPRPLPAAAGACRWLAGLLQLMLATAAPAQPAPWWERMSQAAQRAALAPRTWVPLLGAAALQLGDADRQLQAWAAEQTPLFGSRASADRGSDTLKAVANGLWVASALAPWPSDEDQGGWLAAKTRVVLVQASANMVNSIVVGQLKDGTARMRPNEAGATSFPSDHAARAGLHTQLTRHNLQQAGWGGPAMTVASAGLDTLAALTAWARVEANQHYPSDVLAGLALGHFLGQFFTEAFLPAPAAQNLQLQLQLQLRLLWRF